jgi:hypothetical protein
MTSRAVVPQVVPAKALEVLVPTTVATYGAVQQPVRALPAEQRALQVVLVLTRAVATESVRSQHLLNSLERLLIHERRVQAVEVLDPVQGDDADVVIVLQHPRHRAP